MTTKIKTAILSSMIALGTLAGATSAAQAGPSVGIWFNGHGHGGIVIGTPGYHPGPVVVHPVGKCTKFKALNKAASMGIYNRWVKKITPTRVVVRGKKNGLPVKLTLRRKTSHCKVKSFRYI